MDSREENVHRCRPANINRGGEIIFLFDGTTYNQIVHYSHACCLQVKPDVQESSLAECGGGSLPDALEVLPQIFNLMRPTIKHNAGRI